MYQFHSKSSGYVLIYAVLIMGVILIAITAIFNNSLSEALISRIQDDALKAQYAAEAGIRCVAYFDSLKQAFDTKSDRVSYDCGVGMTGEVGGGAGQGAECTQTPVTYRFTLDDFDNGACADVSVTIQQSGISPTLCDLEVYSDGKNSCAAPTVQRNRWVTL